MKMGIEAAVLSILVKWNVNPKSVQEVMLPMTIFGWLVGLGIFEIPYGNPWPVASFIYVLVVSIFYGVMVRITIPGLDRMTRNFLSSGQIVFKTMFYCNVILNFCCTILGWMRAKNIKNIIERLEESDAKMKSIGLPREYRLIYVRQLTALFLQFIMIGVFILAAHTWRNVLYDTIWQEVVSSIALYYPAVLTSVGDMFFVNLVRFTHMRFDQLNKYLLAMSTTTPNSPQHKRVLEYTRGKKFDRANGLKKLTNDNHIAMSAARSYHHELVKISYMINDTFGVQTLISMTISFITITGLLYTSFSIILWRSWKDESVLGRLVYAACWLSFYVCRTILISAICAQASYGAKRTGNIICHLHEPSTSRTYRNEIRDFTLQLTQHSLTFTACGFFTLNYAFIQGMVGSITTYLVILIQIGQLPSTTIPETVTNSTIIFTESPEYINTTSLR